MSFISGFLITFIAELAIYLIFIKEKKSKIILYCFLINLFTWPLANIIYRIYGLFLAIESGVFLAEWALIFLMFKIDWKKAGLVSFIANLITAILGLLM